MWAPLVRHKRLLLATALVGFCIGAAVPLLRPPEPMATTSLILNHRKDADNPGDAMATDVSMARSRELAVRVVDRLGLRETPDELLKQYTATARTNRVLQLTARAETGTEAKRIVRTVGDELLAFRAEQSRQQVAPLRRALADARAELAQLKRTTGGALATDGSADEVTMQRIDAAQDRVDHLAEQLKKEETAVAPVGRSLVLEPPRIRTPSQLALVGKDGATGLAVGLGGMAALVVLSGLLAYRPRPEREIADVLAPPVEWNRDNVPPPNETDETIESGHDTAPHDTAPRPDEADETVEAAAPEPSYELDPAVEAVRRELEHGDPVRPTLALVPVGSVTATASLAAAVAMRCAEDGDHVLLADLSEHGELARVLGAAETGTSAVLTTEGGEDQISVHRPESDEPQGRLGAEGPDGVDDELLIAWVLSDVVLTLVEPSQSYAVEELHTWADSAAVVATGRRPSDATLRSLDELVRTGGVSLASVVVLDVAQTAEQSQEQEPSQEQQPSQEQTDDQAPTEDLVSQSTETGR